MLQGEITCKQTLLFLVISPSNVLPHDVLDDAFTTGMLKLYHIE